MAGDGAFVATWASDNQDGAAGGIFAQTWDSTGAPVGVEFLVNRYTLTGQSRPAAAMDDSGNIVIVWRSARPGENTGDVLAQRGGEPPMLVPADIDGNTQTAPLEDGLLILRHLFGFSGDALISNAVGPGCSRCDAATIKTYLNGLGMTLDVDGNGEPADALTDGLLFLRYLFGFTGTTLTDNATAPDCDRCDAAEIIPYLDGLV
jgi:hypothetical protein